MQYSFQTHDGQIFESSHERLIFACNNVAAWYEENAWAVLEKDAYAAHVTLEKKMEHFFKQYAWAAQVRQRENLNNFSVWQRVNAELTGECVAFLPK